MNTSLRPFFTVLAYASLTLLGFIAGIWLAGHPHRHPHVPVPARPALERFSATQERAILAHAALSSPLFPWGPA